MARDTVQRTVGTGSPSWRVRVLHAQNKSIDCVFLVESEEERGQERVRGISKQGS